MKRSAIAVLLPVLLLALAAALVGGDLTGASPGTTELVSVDSAGSQGNGFSERAAISADGRFDAAAHQFIYNWGTKPYTGGGTT